jgi:hypothetical protein
VGGPTQKKHWINKEQLQQKQSPTLEAQEVLENQSQSNL